MAAFFASLEKKRNPKFHSYIIIIWGLSFFISDNLHSQVIDETWLAIPEEIPEPTVKCMVQDQDGFLWIGTKSGLLRFDGYNFQIYNNSQDNPNRINNNLINLLFISKKGDLVLFNDWKALDILNLRTNELKKIAIPSNKNYGDIRGIWQTAQKAIYLITENEQGYYLFQYEDLQFKLVWEVNETRIGNPKITDLMSLRFHFLSDSEDRFWLFEREEGLFWRNSKGEITRQFSSSDFEGMEKEKKMPSIVQFMVRDKANRIWLAFHYYPGLFLYNEETGQFDLHSNLFPKNYFFKAWTDQKGNVLIFGRDNSSWSRNVQLIDSNGNLSDFTSYLNSNYDCSLLAGEDFQTLFYQIPHQGILKIFLNQSTVKSFLRQNLSFSPYGISGRGIVEDKHGNLIFSSVNEGWFILEENSDTIRSLSFDQFSEHNLKKPKNCKNFIEDQNGNIWGVGVKTHALPDIPNGYLFEYDPDNQQFKYLVTPYRVNCLIKRGAEELWLPGTTSLLIFNKRTRTFTDYLNANGTNAMDGLNANFGIESRDSLIWIATEQGLLKIDVQKRSSQLFTRETPLKGLNFSNNNFMTIHEAPDGKLWLGTRGGGIHIFDPSTESLRILTKDNGLANNSVCGFVREDDGNYWISTFNGLSYFDIKKETFLNFFPADGFSHHEFNRFSFFKDSHDRLLFGGLNGFNMFRSEDLLKPRPQHRVFLSEIEYFDSKKRSIVRKSTGISNLKKIVLPAENRYLHIYFGFTDFRQLEKNRFSYFLKGFDNDWNPIGNRNDLVFNNLPAGTYQLLIKGADYHGQWTEEPLQLTIVARAFFYKTWWFYLLLTILFSSGVYALYLYRMAQIRKNMEIRTKIASDLHDDVGGLLAGIAMQTELLQLDKSLKDKSRLEKIRTMSQNAISQMRDLVWSVDARKDNLEDLFDRMYEYATSTLQPKGISFEVETSGINTSKQLPLEVRQNIYLIFKEAVTNILRHSNATEVVVTAKSTRKHFELKIKDNGKFQKLDKKATGLGISNMKLRAEKMKATIEFETENGFGILIRLK